MQQKIMIVDLDGTLFYPGTPDTPEERPIITPWTVPNHRMINQILLHQSMGDTVWFWSDRPEEDRSVLYRWLYEHEVMTWMDRFGWWRNPNKLRLRPEGNKMSEATLKYSYLTTLPRLQYSHVCGIYDDNEDTLSLFQRAGFQVVDSRQV